MRPLAYSAFLYLAYDVGWKKWKQTQGICLVSVFKNFFLSKNIENEENMFGLYFFFCYEKYEENKKTIN